MSSSEISSSPAPKSRRQGRGGTGGSWFSRCLPLGRTRTARGTLRESYCDPYRPCLEPDCPNAPTPASSSQRAVDSSTVRLGVGNRSAGDLNIDVYDNVIVGGRQRAHVGSGNTAAGHNTGQVSGNWAGGDDVRIGVDNRAAGGDNYIDVHDNDFRGPFGSVHVGAGNYASGSNRIKVAGPLPASPAAAPSEGAGVAGRGGGFFRWGWRGHGHGGSGKGPGLAIGVGNVAEGGNNDIQVHSGGAIPWTPGAQFGSYNRAGRSNRIIIS